MVDSATTVLSDTRLRRELANRQGIRGAVNIAIGAFEPGGNGSDESVLD